MDPVGRRVIARRCARSPASALARAHDAAAHERWAEALRWTRRARELGAEGPMLLLDEAFFLEELGRADEALRVYEALAARRPDDGEADFHAGNLLLRAGASPREVVARFLRCLERSPDFVHALDDPHAPGHALLRRHPELTLAAARARANLQGGAAG